jgi:hypothetical protein
MLRVRLYVVRRIAARLVRYASQRVLAPILFTLLVIVSWWTLLNMFVSILADECAPPASALGLG